MPKLYIASFTQSMSIITEVIYYIISKYIFHVGHATSFQIATVTVPPHFWLSRLTNPWGSLVEIYTVLMAQQLA